MASVYLGVSSGTSLDAVDVAAADFGGEAIVPVACANYPMDREIARRVARLQTASAPAAELACLDCELGRLFAAAVLDLLARANLAAEDVAAVGLHGQTLLHRPHGDRPYTMQLGDPNVVAATSGIATVADFRRADVALGGQGAPLAPAFHKKLFGRMKRAAVVNVGGIANLTVFDGDTVLGFDTGPGNCLMDAWIRRHRGPAFDDEGRWAASADVDRGLLETLLAHPFLALPPPKSLCTSEFSVDWLEERLAQDFEAASVQATLAEWTATAIIEALQRHAGDTRTLLVCGGGAHNRHLMQRLAVLGDLDVRDTRTEGFDPDYIEALAFAWLASMRMAGASGVIPKVTGARRAAIAGAVYLPPQSISPPGKGGILPTQAPSPQPSPEGRGRIKSGLKATQM